MRENLGRVQDRSTTIRSQRMDIHRTVFTRVSVFLALSSPTHPNHTSLQDPALFKYSVNSADCGTLKTDLQKPHNRIAERQSRSRCFPCRARVRKIQGARTAAFSPCYRATADITNQSPHCLAELLYSLKILLRWSEREQPVLESRNYCYANVLLKLFALFLHPCFFLLL